MKRQKPYMRHYTGTTKNISSSKEKFELSWDGKPLEIYRHQIIHKLTLIKKINFGMLNISIKMKTNKFFCPELSNIKTQNKMYACRYKLVARQPVRLIKNHKQKYQVPG